MTDKKGERMYAITESDLLCIKMLIEDCANHDDEILDIVRNALLHPLSCMERNGAQGLDAAGKAVKEKILYDIDAIIKHEWANAVNVEQPFRDDRREAISRIRNTVSEYHKNIREGLPVKRCPKMAALDDCGACPENGVTCPKPSTELPASPGKASDVLAELEVYIKQQMDDNKVSVRCNPYDYFNIILEKIAALRQVQHP